MVAMVLSRIAVLVLAAVLAWPVPMASAVTPDFSAAQTLQNAATSIGNGTEFTVGGYTVGIFSLSGTFVATVAPEGLVRSGGTYQALTCYDLTGASATTYTAVGDFRCNVTGFLTVRARISSYTSGSVTVTARFVAGGGVVPSSGGVPIPLPIAQGGTGQTGATAAFDALAPTTTTGDLIYFNGTDNVRLAIGAATTVLHGGTNPSYSAVSLTTDVSGVLPTASGGTGLTSGTSGGVLAFTGTTTLASSATLTANAIVLGGGAGAAPTVLGSLGTTTTVLHGNATGAPSFSAVSLTADVSGILPAANGGTGSAFFAVAGPTIVRTYTFPDASATILTTNAAVTVPQGGTGAAPGAGDQVLVSDSTSAATWRTLTDCAGASNAVTYAVATNTWGCNTITAGVAWTGITAGSGSSTTANGDSAIVYNVAQTTAGRISWRFSESAASTSTGTPVLLQVDTIAGSLALPMLVSSRGSEVYRISATAAQILAADGTAAAPVYSFASDSDTGFATNAAGRISAVIDGVIETVDFSSGTLRLSLGSASTTGTFIAARKARGTIASPTVITAGDDLLTVQGFGYVGAVNAYREAARIVFDSAGTIADSATGIGGVIDLATAMYGAGLSVRMRIDHNGHVNMLGSVPIVGACGTSPSVVGNDMVMQVTVGTGGVATSCAVNFTQAWATNAPVCHVQNNTDRVAYEVDTTTSSVTIQAAAAFTPSSVFHVLCFGRL